MRSPVKNRAAAARAERQRLAYERLVADIVARAREGADGFAVDLHAMACEIADDPAHPLRGTFAISDLIWYLAQFGLRCAGAVAVMCATEDDGDPLGNFLRGYSLERDLSASAGGR
jgi:hypothetical protein